MPHPLPATLQPEELAALAASQPERWPEILHHPNVYPDLQQWILAQMQAAGSAVQPAGVAAAPSAGGATPLAAVATPSGVAAAPAGGATTPRAPRRTGLIVLVSVLVAVLALGGTATALALNGTLERWIGGGGGVSEAAAEPEAEYAAGLERLWTADTNDFATPMVGELGQDFSLLRSGFSRASIALFEADYPVVSASRAVFNARGEDSILVMLDAATGDSLLEYDLSGRDANCAADGYATQEHVYCVTTSDQGATSALLRIDASGRVTEQAIDLAVDRVAIGRDRIVLAGNSGTALALDRSLTRIWQRDDLRDGGFAGVDLGGDRTLIRGYAGWTLLDAEGRTLASAAVVGPYENGNGACDARLTESGKLFVASADDACVENVAGINWWGFGENLLGTYLFSSDGRDYVVRQDADGTELLRFPDADDQPLATVFETELIGDVVGVTGGDEPVLVLSGAGTAASFALGDGEEVAHWSVTEAQQGTLTDQAIRSTEQVLLDEAGTALLVDAAYDVHTGERLWSLQAGEEPLWGWTSDAGLVVLGGGCPECSTAGGAYTLSTLTLYGPAGSGGETVSAGERAESTEVRGADLAVPDFIPSCPGSTILLAWAEVSDGWIVVCGIDAQTPSYARLYLNGASAYSTGATRPTSATATAAVTWDPETRRYVIDLADGRVLTLDHTYGTATIRGSEDASAGTGTQQLRMVRYVFVMLDDEVRTEEDSADESGAYGVRTPEATAKDQIRYMIEVLEKSYEGRAIIKESLPHLAGCDLPAGGYGGVIDDMRTVRDNRAELLSMLDGMPVDQIPEGEQLLEDLTEAITQSYAANLEYVAWAEAANVAGCAQLSAAGQAAAAASDAPKARFAERWNRAVAPVYNVRTFDDWYI